MPAKKPAKAKKQNSKPVASKAAAAKKKPLAASKPQVTKKPTSKPVAKPTGKPVAKASAKPAAKPVTKSVTKPLKIDAKLKPGVKPATGKAATVKAKSVAKAPTAKAAPAKSVVPLTPSKSGSKAAVTPVAVTAQPATKPTKSVVAPKAAESLTPPTPIRSAIAVKSSVPVVKSKKDPAVASNDAEDTDLENLSLLAGPRNVKPYQVKRDEEYMNTAQMEHFRTILQSWKKDLMTEVDRTVLHMKDEAANFPDPNDRATQESEFSLELRTRDRERKLIRKIEEALNRIEDGSYGYCTETGEEIGVKRLEARPVATLCVEAQERRERRERQYGDRDDRYR
jgi:RNA polymerase-binding transcription factor